MEFGHNYSYMESSYQKLEKKSIKGHQKANNIVYETARTDLYDLERLGLLEKKKQGKEWVFLSTENLEEKIKNGVPIKKT